MSAQGQHRHWLTRRRIDRVFLRGPSAAARAHRAVLAELPRCAACADRYRRRQVLEAALCSVPVGTPTPLALERLEALVLDDARAAAASRPRETARRRAGRTAWAAVTFAFVAVVVVFLLRGPFGPRRVDDRVALRAADRLGVVAVRGGAATSNAAEVGIRVFRVVPGAGVDEPRALSTDDVLTFTYTNVHPATRFLVLLGIQPAGTGRGEHQPTEDRRDIRWYIRWYYPGPGEGSASVPIAPGHVDEPLGDGIRLRVHHQPGWLRVTAIFSPAPIDTRVIEDAVRALADAESLAPLPLPPAAGALEHSLLLDLASP
jgi:hypothetical protein